MVLAIEALWLTAGICVKLSMLDLYATLLPVRRLRLTVNALTLLLLLYWTGALLRLFFICKPFSYTWNKNLEGGSCIKYSITYGSVYAINAILNAVIVGLPMPIVWRLQVPLVKKIWISVVFGLGGAYVSPLQFRTRI